MVDRHAADMLVDQVEGGAVDDVIDTQPARDPLGESRLPGTKPAEQRDDHPAGEQCTKSLAECLGFNR